MRPLSIVIISYNRPADTLELLKNITTLSRAGELLEEVIILNNASSVSYEEIKSFTQQYQAINFRFIDAPENLGVARGRNFAAKFAQTPLLVFLDDDAELGNTAALVNIVSVFEQHTSTDRPLAILSFKVLYYSTRQMQENAFPSKKFDKYKDEHSFYTAYYAGCGHVIRRAALEEAGYLPEDFFYGMEEYDLSYRILNNGYSIMYDDSIVLLHKESPLGRTTKKEKLRMMWVNKSKVAFRYLPKKYFMSTACMWSLQYLKETRGDIPGFFKGWKQVLNINTTEKRRPIDKKTLDYLQTTEARLWY